ncbi:MFS transporter [Streptacidiphilus cavernicola]|uniref:MFS transporter n=1 Tax=Streptacidiphilus cavernicola TaxID=3342716 RepID=A0ABV6VZG5_9ACTN
MRGAGSARDFWLYWTAGTSDELGSQVSGLVLPVFLLSAGYSPGLVGLFVAVAGLGGLAAGPVAAVLADRASRRPTMVWSAVAAGCAMGSFCLAVALGHPTVPQLAAVVLVERIATSCYAAAAGGTVAALTAPAEYPRAVARLQAGEQGATVLGPALAGVLFQLARWLPFLADAGSYLVTALCVRSIRAELTLREPADAEEPGEPGESAQDAPSLASELGAGLRFVRGNPFLRFLLWWTVGVNAMLSALYYLAVFTLAGQHHGHGSGATGTVLAVSGAAGLLGALAAPRLARRIPAAHIVVAASWAIVPVAAALAFTTRAWAFGLLLGAVSLMVPSVAVMLQARAVLVTEPGLQARVGTVLGTASAVVAAVVPAGVGLLADRTGSTGVGLTCAVLLTLLALRTTTGTARWNTTPTGPGPAIGHDCATAPVMAAAEPGEQR